MQITTSRRLQNRAQLRPEAKTPNSYAAPTKSGPLDTVATLPSHWQDIDTQSVKLPDSPPPALARPVVFLHGFNGSAERWDKVFEWLTSGDKPVNKEGGIIDAGKFENIDPQANLFSLRLSRPYNSVETNKAELKAAVEAVLDATGAEEVDLVVHSLGGLNARSYLQDDDEKVNKLVMLGTPNHGSGLANLEKFFRKNFDYPVLPPVDDPEVRRVLDQLSVDKLDGDKNPENPWLRGLNNDWESHRERADIMIVAGAGIPTVTGGPGLTIFGDGVVTRRSAKLSGVERKTSWFRTHGGLQNSGKVMEATANFLAGNRLTQSENLFDSPEDVLRAAELVDPPKTPGAQPIERVSLEEAKRATKLPLLDPAFQMGLALGVLSAMMGGPKQNLPLIELGLNSDTSGNEVQANYNVDLARSDGQVQGSGFVDGRAFAEVADFQEGKMYWKSALGLESSGLVMEVGEDEKSITMKGEMGGVPTDLKLELLLAESGKIAGLETTGLFNGEDYKVKSTVDMGGLLKGDVSHDGTMQVSGRVNGEDMQRSYKLDVEKNEKGLKFKARTSDPQTTGQDIGVTVRVRER